MVKRQSQAPACVPRVRSSLYLSQVADEPECAPRPGSQAAGERNCAYDDTASPSFATGADSREFSAVTRS